MACPQIYCIDANALVSNIYVTSSWRTRLTKRTGSLCERRLIRAWTLFHIWASAENTSQCKTIYGYALTCQVQFLYIVGIPQALQKSYYFNSNILADLLFKCPTSRMLEEFTWYGSKVTNCLKNSPLACKELLTSTNRWECFALRNRCTIFSG